MRGQRFRSARRSAGLSLRQLALRIDNLVSPQAIGKYERDEAEPSDQVLSALGAALSVPVSYLRSEPDLVLEGIDFRRKRTMGRRAEAHLEARVLAQIARYLRVEEALALPSTSWDQPREAPYPASDPADADRAARSLRVAWGLGLDPISNLVELLEERGIKVHIEPLDPNLDGLMARVRRSERQVIPVIIVNATHWGERQRFSLAHELAHLVLDVAPGVDEEKAAHRFAGAFLMPAETLWAEIGKHRTSISLVELLALKRLFGASIQAITYRLRDLRIIPEGEFKRLFDLYTERGWRSPPFEEPEAVKDGEKPQRLRRLCFRAMSEDVIAVDGAAEILGMSVDELRSQIKAEG